MTPYTLVNTCRHFGENFCVYIQCIRLKYRASRFRRNVVGIYQTTQCHRPDEQSYVFVVAVLFKLSLRKSTYVLDKTWRLYFVFAKFAQPQIFASTIYRHTDEVRDLKYGAWIIHCVIIFVLNLIKFALLVHTLLRSEALCHAADKN